MSYPWPNDILKETLFHFADQTKSLRQWSDIKHASLIFNAAKRNNKAFLPSCAWWDWVDVRLASLAKRAFKPMWDHRWQGDCPHAIAAAVARYEPVLGKIPHYYVPNADAWNDNLMQHGSIEQHFGKLQKDAIDTGTFDRAPATTPPKRRSGLIYLLEYMAVHGTRAERWARQAAGITVLDGSLVVHDLKACPYVSREGQKWYRQKRGCLLVPFVAHDRRLVGHGIVLFDQALPLLEQQSKAFLKELVHGWRVLFGGTFEPLIANLNCAALSALDGHFLGRVRNLRQRIHAPLAGGRRLSVPAKDILILNKIALYELLKARLNEKKKQQFWLVFFDLDGFKKINGEIGHQLADLLLFYIADELAGREGIFSPGTDRWLGRFGGDEFVGVIPATMSYDVKTCSEKIADAIRRGTVNYNKSQFGRRKPYRGPVSTSMGWVHTNDIDKLNINISSLTAKRKRLLTRMNEFERLIEMADTDTQEYVKRLGKNGYLLFKKRQELPDSENALVHCLPSWLRAIRWLPSDRNRREQVPRRICERRDLNIQLWHVPS